MIAAIIPFLTALGGSVVAQFVKVFSVETAKFLAWRAFILFIVFIIMPILLYNIAVDLIFDLMSYAIESINGNSIEPVTISITGMGGWMADRMQIPECISIIMTAISVRFTMNFIPFLR